MQLLNTYRNRWVLTGALTVIVLSGVNVWGAYFQDDFNKPDGEVGNGWMTWTDGTIEVKIVDNEVLIAGRQGRNWWRSGISRFVEGQTRFSFDFKTDDQFNVHIELYDQENPDGIDFYAWPGGPFYYSYRYRVSNEWTGWIQIPGSEMMAGQYNTLVVEQDGADYTLTLNGQEIGTVTKDNIIRIGEVFIGSDAAAGIVGSLHIDNVKIGQAPVIPIFDFNGDGIVDSADMCVMIDHWGEDYSLCDIGPTPSGDGIIDVEDLKVLAEHLFEEVNDPTLVAHWALDETEGMFAVDRVSSNNAMVIGNAVWQPNGGQIDGALELDGVDGCAITNPVLNPADGPFSIIAWVKGDAPGQVIVSQQIASDWLAIDTNGNLMTELKSSDQLAGPLLSDAVITNGQWHRIGLVWDGSKRTLCVDGVAVAEDTQTGLESSQIGLYIGVDKNYAPGTFFSGLIDDIRIYNRAVSP